MAAMKPLQKGDFETAMGHELTDDQYDTLRFGVSLGFPGGGGLTIPKSNAQMSPAQAEAIGRIHYLQHGQRSGEPIGWAQAEKNAAKKPGKKGKPWVQEGADEYIANQKMEQGAVPLSKLKEAAVPSSPSPLSAYYGDPNADDASPFAPTPAPGQGTAPAGSGWQGMQDEPKGLFKKSPAAPVPAPGQGAPAPVPGQGPAASPVGFVPAPNQDPALASIANEAKNPYKAKAGPNGQPLISKQQAAADAKQLAEFEAEGKKITPPPNVPVPSPYAAAAAQAKQDVVGLEADAAKLEPATLAAKGKVKPGPTFVVQPPQPIPEPPTAPAGAPSAPTKAEAEMLMQKPMTTAEYNAWLQAGEWKGTPGVSGPPAAPAPSIFGFPGAKHNAPTPSGGVPSLLDLAAPGPKKKGMLPPMLSSKKVAVK